MSRSRTFTWDDPADVHANLRRLSGLEFLTRVANGEFPGPPMARLMDIRITHAEKGRVIFEGTPQEFHYNPLGVVHGGMAATLLDSALGCCVNSHLDAGDLYTTLELKVNYLRPITLATGPVRAIATTIHIGRTTALVEGTVVDAHDKIYAYASSTCLIRRAQSPPEDATA
jgi:uncharacterized protein (TIGR00369 family)